MSCDGVGCVSLLGAEQFNQDYRRHGHLTGASRKDDAYYNDPQDYRVEVVWEDDMVRWPLASVVVPYTRCVRENQEILKVLEVPR